MQQTTAVNESLPGQLTVGRLRQLLDGVDEQAVVVLRVCKTLDVPSPLQSVLMNLRVARIGSPVVVLEVHSELSAPPPQPVA